MTDKKKQEALPWMKAICYSGFRRGQNPGLDLYPSHKEIEEDLRLLEKDWDCIRLYDAGIHGQRVLEVIETKGIKLKVLLGICLAAEVSNPECPWGADYSDEVLAAGTAENEKQIEKLAQLACSYSETVVAVSAGNEATVSWNDHMVPVDRVIHYVKTLKKAVHQPVTFCENYVPWQGKLIDLAEEVDFISLHTYPLWEYKRAEEGMAYSIENYQAVKACYPDKQIVITEAGWATASNGRGMPAENASQADQAAYCSQLLDWAEENKITVFLFEAFDEDWKGSEDLLEPEKHWGIYHIDRQPKYYLQESQTIRR